MNNPLQDFLPTTLSPAMDANEIAFWTFHLHHFPEGVLHDDPEVFWFETGIRHDVFNRVIRTHLTSDTFVPVENILSSFRQRRLPFLWHLGPDSYPANLGSFLEEHGMVHYETEPAMVVDLLRFHEDLPVATQLTIHRVTTYELLEQWVRVWEFESSEEVIRLWLTFYSSSRLGEESPLRLYLGMINGEPVANSGVFFGGGVASIGPIGTLPQHRRQGIGAAMTLAALRSARSEGYRIGVLTASPMGIKTYRRVGFQEFGSSSVYLWHPMLHPLDKLYA